jgi:DNA-binding NarL/FixJ family response regulator
VVTEIMGKYRLKTLIVDNSTQVREHLISLVSHLDSVELVGDVGNDIQALEAIQALQPDVIILDLYTSKEVMDLLQTIKNISPKSVIVLLAFYPYSRNQKEFIHAGADYVLDKLTEVNRVGKLLEALV